MAAPNIRPLPREVTDRMPIWLTGVMLGGAIVMIASLLLFIAARGMVALWPSALHQITLRDGSRILGLVHRVEHMPPETDDGGQPRLRTLFRTGNRDVTGNDFVWLDHREIAAQAKPREAVAVERLEWGPFYGFVQAVVVPGKEPTGDAWTALRGQLPAAARRRKEISRLQERRIGNVNTAMERHRLAIAKLQHRGMASTEKGRAAMQQRQAHIAKLQIRFEELANELTRRREEDQAFRVVLATVESQTKELPISSIVRIHRPNQLDPIGRTGVYLSRLGEFVFGQPREANSEGGVAPAIFGTVLMTLLMTIAVVPLGVLAALYLHEYAKQGAAVSAVRIAVNNLAGVPSIVFGVFGLGFFCYLLGGGIDRLFFAERLPTPTFGGGAIIWASLTLALLTVPVVIVATEEALAAVPDGLRAASLACGATTFQTIWHVVLPAALPGIMTGAILAMARGAGEVAPLMITGVVKLAPNLPLDHIPPFLHLERKFMHLGFHIYDVGFMTTLLLIAIVVCLNLTAIWIRGHLREQAQGSDV